MKYKIHWLIFWYFVYDFINEPLKWLIMRGETEELFFWLYDFTDFMREVSFNGSCILYAAIAYTGFYFFFPKRKWAACIGTLLVAFTLPIAFRYILEQVIYDVLWDFRNYNKDVSITFYARDNYYYALQYVIFGVAYYLIRYAIYNEGQQKELAIQNQKMELSMLRSQINPHFLLNSMNNIYSLVYQKSDKSLDAINTLSGVLKYSLYEKKEFVTVKEELNNVEKIIDLNKLRFDYELPIEMNVEKSISNNTIPPFIIIPLIENAFKHGDLKDSNTPLKINIGGSNNQIQIEVVNKIGNHLKDEVGGIGLENIQKRLELIYPNNHHFNIDSKDGIFKVNIKIPTR